MAEVDASIPLQVQGPQPITLNSIAQMYQMQQQIQMQKQQRQVQNALSQIYSNPANLGPDGMPNAQAMMQIAKISPQTAQQLTTQRATVDEKMALTSKDQQEAAMAFQKNVQAQVREPALNAYDEALKQGKNPQQAQMIGQKAYSDGLDNLIQSGYVPDSMKSQLSQNFDPSGVRASALSYKDRLAAEQKQDTLSSTNAYRQAELGLGQERVGLEAQRVGMEGERLGREQAADTAGGQLSPEAIKDAAARYNLDGTLPPLGMGKQGLMVRNAILNTAADMAKGKDPTQQRVEQIDAKAAGQARGQLEKNANNIELAEKTAVGSADMVLNSSDKYKRSDVQAFNGPLNEFRSKYGNDTNYTQFANNINTFKNEYVKVMTGSGQATDSARAEADHMINPTMTHDQVKAAISAMKQEMQQVREDAIKQARGSSSEQTRNPETGASKTLTYDPATGTFK